MQLNSTNNVIRNVLEGIPYKPIWNKDAIGGGKPLAFYETNR